MELILNDTSYPCPTRKREYEVVDIRDMTIQPCYGCGGCTYTGRCVLHDDMEKLLYKIAKCEHLVLLTEPIFGSYSIMCKRILDRMSVLGDTRYTVTNKELRKLGFRTNMKDMEIIIMNDVSHDEVMNLKQLLNETSLLLGMNIYLSVKGERL